MLLFLFETVIVTRLWEDANHSIPKPRKGQQARNTKSLPFQIAG